VTNRNVTHDLSWKFVTAANLEDVQEATHQCTKHAQLTNADELITPLADIEDSTMCAAIDLPSEAEDLIFSAASLPSADEEELAFISICSSKCRSPSSSEYNLTIPPYNYNEAMCRPDRDIWQAMIDKELLMFTTMKIFAIGSTWVFEYKLVDLSPPLPKGRLCTRGYSQIPNADIFTKPLPHPIFELHHTNLGLLAH
jgi:hypothetical protein